MTAALSITYRDTVVDSDREAVHRMVESSGFFSSEEVEMAVELVDERLKRGAASGYHFLFAELDGSPAGYACFGPICCTRGSYDLYWIAVHDDWRGRGIGKRLLRESERAMKQLGARRIYIETSSRDQYEPTRGFYLNNGYDLDAVLKDFYAPGDSKVIFSRQI